MVKNLGPFKITKELRKHLSELGASHRSLRKSGDLDVDDWVQILLDTKDYVGTHSGFKDLYRPEYNHVFRTQLNDMFYRGAPKMNSMALASARIHTDDFNDEISTILVYVHAASSRHALYQEGQKPVPLKAGNIYSLNQKQPHALLYDGEDQAYDSRAKACIMLTISFER